ncbi:glycosyltransferase [Agromyces larvae]|uniref:4,4'-diaponeurosporenoate glycosyltransferase n=1 Tax=Agromyces larvae TaxID=2929802 RepID=A0ABY4BYI8_9MICO|nr:glycosyltransferase [Agromyces larvae]UOE42746.1 glycosyltransferase [Agromyces larvae]
MTMRAAARLESAVDLALPSDGAVLQSFSPAWAVDVRGRAANARGAIIIPAHNEEAVIDRTLRSITRLGGLPGIEVIVVCNGCSDGTAAAARRHPGIRVLEITTASKTAAMNAGDAAASRWPRLYLDADIDIEPVTVLTLFDALAEGGALAARPYFAYDIGDASAPVRAYYRARSRIPAPATRLWGAGGYAANEIGHRRFGVFASVTADDSWFDEQFEEEEKLVVPAPPMRVRTPRDMHSLLAVLARQHRGHVELGIPSAAQKRVRAVLASIRGPRSAIDACWYLALTAIARRPSAWIMRRREVVWERDASTRVGRPRATPQTHNDEARR